MESEDVISLPASSPGNGSEDNEVDDSVSDQIKIDSEMLEVEVDKEVGVASDDIAYGDNQLFLATDSNKDVVDNPPTWVVSIEAAAVSGKTTVISSLCTENGHLSGQDGSSSSKEVGHGQETGASLLSGVKRSRLTVDEQEPSVQIIFKSLTRDSKNKLEELLQQWSQWHAQHCSSENDSNKVLESGEETYFPAIQVGIDKPSTVSFWMESETRNRLNKELIQFDGDSAPLYDRGYSLALTSTDGSNNVEGAMGIAEASRCFNCGSYNHSLKECPKPRDNVAVNNARKQHKSQRMQNASSRNPTRYYQTSPGGRYDGLKAGTLDSETRQVLGLRELDPPPWLNRMREIGYPPGYLEDEEEPSGITIFGDEERREETEEGEILEASFSPRKKMSVEFPGVNAPIPKNANEKRWASGPSDLYLSRDHHYRRHHHPSSDPIPISRSQHHEQRWLRDFDDNEPPPPGCEAENSFSAHSRRYDPGYTSHSSRDSYSGPRNSSFGRPLSDRSRRSPLIHDGSSKHRAYGSNRYSSPR